MAISITDKAATKVQDYLKQVNDQNLALRVFVKAGGCAGYQFGLKLDKTGTSDVIEHRNGVNIVADPKSATSTSKTPSKISPTIFLSSRSEDNACNATPKSTLARKLAGTKLGA